MKYSGVSIEQSPETFAFRSLSEEAFYGKEWDEPGFDGFIKVGRDQQRIKDWEIFSGSPAGKIEAEMLFIFIYTYIYFLFPFFGKYFCS